MTASRSASRLTRRRRTYPPPKAVFTKRGDPAHASFPECTTATRSLSASASSMKCVVSNTETGLMSVSFSVSVAPWPPFLPSPRRPARPRMTSQACLLETGSIPAVGSSRSTTLGSPMNAIAKLSLRL